MLISAQIVAVSKLDRFSLLGSVRVGSSERVRVIGAINTSPESFYKGSIAKNAYEALSIARKMMDEGADIIDVGGMSSAPYKDTLVPEDVEIERVVQPIKMISKELGATVSIDTWRSGVAERALSAGAQIVNDVTGLRGDQRMAKVIAEHSASAILMARELGEKKEGEYILPIIKVRKLLRESVSIARGAGIDVHQLVVDPGIGFFRNEKMAWYDWDISMLASLKRLSILGLPILVGVSRKSFIGAITGISEPEERIFGSIAAEAIAVSMGADAVRSHNVKETYQAVRMAERFRILPSNIVQEKGTSCFVMSGLEEPEDVSEILEEIGVEEKGKKILAKKGIFKVIKLEGLPLPLCHVVKQELLSMGGDAGTPKSAIKGDVQKVDIVIFATISQLARLCRRLSRMHFSFLKQKGMLDAPELAKMIEHVAL